MNEMPERVWQLLRTTLSRTENGELAWRPGSSETEFILSLAHGAIAISSVDEDGQHPFRLSILRPDGVQVDSWVSTRNDTPQAWWREFGQLYAAARRSSLGSTEVVNALLKDLEDDDEIPF